MTRARRLRAAAVAALLSLALATACSDDPVGSAGEPESSGTSARPSPRRTTAGGTDRGSAPPPPRSPTPSTPSTRPGSAPARWSGRTCGSTPRSRSATTWSSASPANRRVERVERISLGDVGIENRVINIAAVDPSTYRNFTVRESAELQEQWDRVAGGELAHREGARPAAPGQGGLPQARQRRGRARRAHRRLRAAGAADRRGRQREVGRGARHPDRQRDADQHRHRLAARRDGGPAGDRRRRRRRLHPRSQPRPGCAADRRAHRWLGRRGRRHVPLHRARRRAGSRRSSRGSTRTSAPSRSRSWATSPATGWSSRSCGRRCSRSRRRGLADEIHAGEYAGCYYPRYIAGTQQLSLHSFGIALDLNVPGNQRGTVGEMNRAVVRDLQEVGLRLGWRLGLHRPHALRDERDRRPGVGTPDGRSSRSGCAISSAGSRAHTVATTATTTGTMPAMKKVLRSPIASATGPASAIEIGISETLTKKSSEATRPSRCGRHPALQQRAPDDHRGRRTSPPSRRRPRSPPTRRRPAR